MESYQDIIDRIKKIDSENMFEILKKFPEQVREAVDIGNSIKINEVKGTNDVVILGMGGSAIGGDLLRSYCNSRKESGHLRFLINRSYDLPSFIDGSPFIIGSSYSGGTEETISSFKQAMNLTSNLACISTGGELSKIAVNHKIPVVAIPGGLQPRCAVGYSFFPMLFLLIKTKLISKPEGILKSIFETIQSLPEKAEKYSTIDDKNLAINIAQRIKGKIPIIYSASERTDVLNLRWRGQIQENAKNAAFGAYLPEMNHNEINGFSNPEYIKAGSIIIFLRDEEDHPRVKIRFDALEEILRDSGIDVLSLQGSGSNLMTRIFDLLYLADWVSYYLAVLLDTDPTPIPLITKLKEKLTNS